MKVFWIDLFCGAGGTTIGISNSYKNSMVAACVNHDPRAIHWHSANNPDCLHFTEDVTSWKVIQSLSVLVDNLRLHNPRCIINIWASLECTHFSGAKGGQSRDADSRTLAWHLLKYIDYLDPDYLYIENVREFMSWGPMFQEFKKCKGKKIFKANDLNNKKKIVWCESSHEDTPELYSSLNYLPHMKPIPEKKGETYAEWVSTVKGRGYDYEYQLLNAADFGAYTRRIRYFSIFSRKGYPIKFPKPTHARYGANGLIPWKPAKDILDLNDHGVSIFDLTKLGKKRSQKTVLRLLKGVKKFNGEKYFIANYNGNGDAQTVNEPLCTLTTKERLTVQFVNYEYGTGQHLSLEEPLGTITTNPKGQLVSAQWLYDHQYEENSYSIDKPMQTLIAQMEKKPVYFATTLINGEPNRSIELPDDNEAEKELKQYMRSHGIRDVKLRMVNLRELRLAQGFPDYYLLGDNKTNSLKFIGNSVAPAMSKNLADCNMEALTEYFYGVTPYEMTGT